MASACRSALMAGARTFAARSSLITRTRTPKPIPASPFSSSTRATPSAALRVAAVLGSVESMMPLHSAIAAARLKSSIAVDSACWSFLSQGI
ncbi:hypothetical protein RJ640_016416 [Escallonia rubra]|uniref:Protein NUCLEAR FUSION DEFECTIVE 6, chloroplastic/mitochondrial-like n=1 Tax=Escallonia rubra TaxID=112253 RepID=A0AA88RYP9_9ASTE|nr:hypothetical protein RJ640_016416 [Escallonia rubra]